jgi:hypothetical protein
VVNVLALDPRYAGSNPAEDDGLLIAIKIRITPSFGGEFKLSVSCKILRHVKEPYNHRIDNLQAKFTNISRHVSPASLSDVAAGRFQRALVDESRMIRIQMGRTIDEKWSQRLDALCDTTP